MATLTIIHAGLGGNHDPINLNDLYAELHYGFPVVTTRAPGEYQDMENLFELESSGQVIVVITYTAAEIQALATNGIYVAPSRLITTTAPLTGGGDLTTDRTIAISPATDLAAGSMSAADKTKLDSLQKWSNAVYPVFVGGPYATITAAITQAVADGHTDITNPAVVLISPKFNGWAEDISLSAGVNLQGLWGSGDAYSVLIAGKITWTPASGGIGTQKVSVQGLYASPGVGKPALELVGSNVGQLWVSNCVLNKQEGTAPVVSVNGNASSELHLTDCIGNLIGTGTAYDIESGKFFPSRVDISSSDTGRSLKVGAVGNITALEANFVSKGADVVNVASGGVVLFDDCFITQQTSGNDGIVNAGGSVTGIYTTFSVAGAGYCVRGTGVFAYAYLAFLMSSAKVQVPGLTVVPFTTAPVPTP